MEAFLNRKNLLILDIGTESVKALISSFSKESIDVLGAAVEYFDKYGFFDSKDFERALLEKTISKAIKGAQDTLSLSGRSKEIFSQKKECLVSLPADFFKARVGYFSFERKESEKKISKKEKGIIQEKVLARVREDIAENFTAQTGILPGEIKWLETEITDLRIDGYKVDSLEGFEGKKVEFRVLAIFIPNFYFDKIKKILEGLGLRVLRFVHIAKGISSFVKDGLFIDVGGEISQFFFLEKGVLEEIGEFKAGSKSFSDKLAEDLGIDETIAREMKESYAEKELSPEVRQKIKNLLSAEREKWYKLFRKEVDTLSLRIPRVVYLSGGGSLMPEIANVLKEKQKDSRFSEELSVNIVFPKDLNIKDKTNILNSPQFIPSLLISHYAREILRRYSAKK